MICNSRYPKIGISFPHLQPALCFDAAVCLWRLLIVSPCHLHTIAIWVYQIFSGRSVSLWGDTIPTFNQALVKPQTRWCHCHILHVHPPTLTPSPSTPPSPSSLLLPPSGPPLYPIPPQTPASRLKPVRAHVHLAGESGAEDGLHLSTVLLEINELMLCVALTYPLAGRPHSQSRRQKPRRRRQPAPIEVLLIGWTFNFPLPEITVIVNQAEWLTLTCFHKVVRHIN